ncbi:MarR family transcriptional regulator [Solidesulfovibrio sp.]|uniref:MarR family winged helix-turn-helix transcriptional regulator n=1 Tax=Solidesulfovibrio sp. TaxID=2910990 RepID=UPI0026099317|nr:MarR family transcriptional regulator [Solidesulfovibrio sp.]
METPDKPDSPQTPEAAGLTRLLIEFYEKFSSWEHGVVRESGLTLPQMHTLEILGADGDLRMTELAARMGVTTGSLTVLVDRLERGGYVSRKPHETDRRSIRVGLTGEGARLFAEHHALHERLTQELLCALSPEEAGQFAGLLARLTACL